MSMSVRSMLILKSIGRSDTGEPGAYAGVGLGACSAARSLGKEAVGADLADGAHDGAFFAAVVDVLLEALECGYVRQRTWSVLGVGRGDVDKAHAVVELERRVTEPGWLRLVQFGVHRPDELLVLGPPLGLDLVANNDVLHFRKPPRIDWLWFFCCGSPAELRPSCVEGLSSVRRCCAWLSSRRRFRALEPQPRRRSRLTSREVRRGSAGRAGRWLRRPRRPTGSRP